MWVDGEMTALELPVWNDELPISGVARAINDFGLIVGELSYPSGATYATAWINEVPSFLPDAFGNPVCSVSGISEAGLIAGACVDPITAKWQPVIWKYEEIGLVPVPFVDFPLPFASLNAIVDTPNGYAAVGNGLDDPSAPTYVNGFVIVDGEVQVLTGPATHPNCQIWSLSQTDDGLLSAGGCFADPSSIYQTVDVYAGMVAAAWLDGNLIELENSFESDGWTLLLVRGTNSLGQMVGLGERNGERRSFILTPVK